MSNLNCSSNTLNQPVISSFIGQKTVTHMSPVLKKIISNKRIQAPLSKSQMKIIVQWKEMYQRKLILKQPQQKHLN